MLLAPGERADVIVDFTGHKANSTILMNNDAKAPFPNGTPADPQTVGQIMQFRVVPPTTPDTSSVPTSLSTILTLGPVSVTLTLNEVMGAGGPTALFLDGKMCDAPVTENPRVGATELWEVINLTRDTHPILFASGAIPTIESATRPKQLHQGLQRAESGHSGCGDDQSSH